SLAQLVERLELSSGDVRGGCDLLVLGRDRARGLEPGGIGLGLADELSRPRGPNLRLCHLPDIRGNLAWNHAQRENRGERGRQEQRDDDRARQGTTTQARVAFGTR